MTDYGFKSDWAKELNEYIDSRVLAGYKSMSYIKNLRYFDRFCLEHGIAACNFTEEDAETFRIRPDSISHSSHYHYVNTAKIFLQRLVLKGINVCPPCDVSKKFEECRPHIYSQDEIIRYFHAVDTYEYGMAGKMAIMMPVFFRILYCCGTRIGETLAIKKQDIDLESGVIKLSATKNGKERYTVVPDELRLLLNAYADKVFWSLQDTSPIFPGGSYCTGNISGSSVHWYHQEFLRIAGIPFLGGKKGPRIHDFRHTAIVRCCKQLIDSGMDMYTAMPFLATWAGHTSTSATEYYLRLTAEVYPWLQDKLKGTWDKVFEELEIPE